MLFQLLLLLQLLSWGDPACVRGLLSTHEQDEEVFIAEGDANSFLGRHLLLNRFDFEMFVPGNLERECYEEVCSYEEAREAFEDTAATNAFWKEYTADKHKGPTRVDVTSLLVGLIASGVAVVIVGVLIWYACRGKFKSNMSRASSMRARPRRSNAALIMRRLDEVSQQPLGPPSMEPVDPPGLPSYDQAIANTGSHDAPPPPYPGSRSGTIQR